jgi:proline dehydrogenase
MSLLTVFACRFVAGERPADAVRVGEWLSARGIKATFDIERNISIKMSSLGQEISRELCLANVSSILEVAAEVGGFVRLDMEGSSLTQDTIEIFQELRRRHQNVGIVLQASLHRTADDVKEAIRRGDRVRLCKGAYKEPPRIALQDMDAIRERYLVYARQLLDAGNLPAIATHDERLIGALIDYAGHSRIAPSRFEFQMLFGLRRRRWRELVGAGYAVRIYVPFGTHWIPYFYRRLRERRENVLFVLRHLFR